MPTIGGSLFVRNAIQYDYCVEAAIESLVPVCTDIVVLDCYSDDGTLDLLHGIAKRHDHVRVIDRVPWEQADHYLRLAILANAARELVKADWHFMIQADEVLHESSHEPLRQAAAADGWGTKAFRVRRFNLYGDLGHCLRLDSHRKPCSDQPTRFGVQTLPAAGDAESIVEDHGVGLGLIDKVTLFHYGYVRRGPALIAKAIDMQSWFFGPHSQPDERIVRMRDTGAKFLPYDIIPPEELMPIPMAHPVAATVWVEGRK